MDNDSLDVNNPITACQQALLKQPSHTPFERCKAVCVCRLQQPCSFGWDEHQPYVPSGTCFEEARSHVCRANIQQENGLMCEATGSQCIAPDSDYLAQNLIRHPSTFSTENCDIIHQDSALLQGLSVSFWQAPLVANDDLRDYWLDGCVVAQHSQQRKSTSFVYAL